MDSEKWTALKSWFNTTGYKSKTIPVAVSVSIAALLDERESADDDDYEEDED